MREILIKAKRIDNGEWVEGGYWLNDTVTRQTHHIIDSDGDTHSVDPDTACQYTGKDDKKHIRIFENDTCEFRYFGNKYKGKIVFNEKTAAFEIWYNTVVGAYGEEATHKILICHCENIEVVGSIFDEEDDIRCVKI